MPRKAPLDHPSVGHDPPAIARPHAVRRAVVCHDGDMRLLQRTIGLMRRPMAERHARGRDLGQLGTELEASGRVMDAIGNHTFDHPSFPLIGARERRQ